MDYFTKNESGLGSTEMFASTLGITNTDFAGVQLWDSYSQNLMPWGKEAIQVWTDSAKLDGVKPNLLLTPEEQEIVNAKLSDIFAYWGSLFNDIIVGNRELSELDKAQAELDKLGIQEILTAYNQAYERYQKVNKE